MEITRIPLEGLTNTRDLAGFETRDGRRIRPHRLIRSGRLFDATGKDRRILSEDYGVSIVVDFRTDSERRLAPDPAVERARNHHLPIYQTVGLTGPEGDDADLFGMAAQLLDRGDDGGGFMMDLYRDFVRSPAARTQYRRFFDLLLEAEEGAVLWHCSAGKDRAGAGTALLLTALGVPREAMVEDYLKSNDFAGEIIELLAEEGCRRMGDPRAGRIVRRIIRAEAPYIQSLFEEAETRYGSMEAFLERGLGLMPSQLRRLRENYLE